MYLKRPDLWPELPAGATGDRADLTLQCDGVQAKAHGISDARWKAWEHPIRPTPPLHVDVPREHPDTPTEARPHALKADEAGPGVHNFEPPDLMPLLVQDEPCSVARTELDPCESRAPRWIDWIQDDREIRTSSRLEAVGSALVQRQEPLEHCRSATHMRSPTWARNERGNALHHREHHQERESDPR